MYTFLLLFSACLGSFSSACIYRHIHNEDFITDRSRCPHCHHTLAWWQLFPIISYVLLKGKCYYCHKRISYVYPLNECLHMLLFVIIFAFTHDYPTSLLWGIYSSMCLNLSIIDSKTQLVPTSLLLILLIVIVSIHHPTMETISLACFTFSILCLLYLFNKHSMGFGDVLYITIHSMLLTPSKLCKAIFISCILAICFLLSKKRNQFAPIPFIPFLTIGFCILLMH